MSEGDKNVVYEFGAFCIDPLTRQLSRNKKPLQLTPKAFATLLMLVENQGQTISKTDLLNSIWPDTAVEENNLTQQISCLRKILGEQPRDHKFIVTIPGGGYRFVAAVNVKPHVAEIQNVISEPPNRASAMRSSLIPVFAVAAVILFFLVAAFWVDLRRAVSRPSPQTIAVLPFRSAGEDTDFFATGMRDTLTAKLGNLQEILNVRPTNTTVKYGDLDPLSAGRELNVDAVLDGTVQYYGEQVRVTVQMVDVADGRVMWGKSYDSFVADRFAAQDVIASQVIEGIEEFYARN
jgi:DNA-binding winged helix-turn-helix (wHTH) protein/TolB-like protein